MESPGMVANIDILYTHRNYTLSHVHVINLAGTRTLGCHADKHVPLLANKHATASNNHIGDSHRRVTTTSGATDDDRIVFLHYTLALVLLYPLAIPSEKCAQH